MAKGWGEIEQAAAATQAQREMFNAQRKPMFRVNQNNVGPFVIRFLEQGSDVSNFPVHDYKEPTKNGVFNRQFTCLSEIGMPCPGCQAGMKQKRRGVFNVIQRNRPVIRVDKDGKAIKHNDQYIVDGYADAVVIASVGEPTAEMLRRADGTYHGLMQRDFQVYYSGETFQPWTFTPVMDGSGNSSPTPMSESDLALAAQKHNLDEFMSPPTVQEASRIVQMFGGNSGASPNAQPAQAPPQGNAYAQGAPQPNGFIAGAQMPPGMAPNVLGGGGVQAPAQPPGPPAPVPQQ